MLLSLCDRRLLVYSLQTITCRACDQETPGRVRTGTLDGKERILNGEPPASSPSENFDSQASILQGSEWKHFFPGTSDCQREKDSKTVTLEVSYGHGPVRLSYREAQS